MTKLNCWEFKKCGREYGGAKAKTLGICPVGPETKANGLHEGKNAGRVCWVVAGTFCGGKIQGTFSDKIENCVKCDFYRLVKEEEGAEFLSLTRILNKLKENK